MYLYVQENHCSQNIIREGKVGATLHSRITWLLKVDRRGIRETNLGYCKKTILYGDEFTEPMVVLFIEMKSTGCKNKGEIKCLCLSNWMNGLAI